jgi:hemolysin activation/secretion protein
MDETQINTIAVTAAALLALFAAIVGWFANTTAKALRDRLEHIDKRNDNTDKRFDLQTVENQQLRQELDSWKLMSQETHGKTEIKMASLEAVTNERDRTLRHLTEIVQDIQKRFVSKDDLKLAMSDVKEDLIEIKTHMRNGLGKG